VEPFAEFVGVTAEQPDVVGGRRGEGVHRLMEVIERFDGRPCPTTPGLVRQWVTGRVRYDPGRFWSGDRIELIAPFALGGEIAVR
jgi:hypothetical protein